MTSSRYLIAGAVAALLQMGIAAAQSPTPNQNDQPTNTPGMEQGTSFESLDKNGDGRISKSEAASDPKVSQQFKMYDKNGNGYIERGEVTGPSDMPAETPKQ